MQRLSALGGSSVESHTRKCLSYILANELAVLFNWKGREKLAFEKYRITSVIFGKYLLNFLINIKQLIYVDAARRLYPNEEGAELRIAKTTKDWLKYAKARLQRK